MPPTPELSTSNGADQEDAVSIQTLSTRETAPSSTPIGLSRDPGRPGQQKNNIEEENVGNKSSDLKRKRDNSEDGDYNDKKK